MKRYALFAGWMPEPIGGWDDFKGDYDTVEEAEAKAKAVHADWWHVVDLHVGVEVSEG